MKDKISVTTDHKRKTLRIVTRGERVITVKAVGGHYEMYIPRDNQNGVRPNAFAFAPDEMLEIAQFLLQDLASDPYWEEGRRAVEFLRQSREKLILDRLKAAGQSDKR